MRTLSLPAGLRSWTKPIQPAPLSSAEGRIWASALCLILFFLGHPIGLDHPFIFWQRLAAVIGVVALALTIHTLRPPTIPWSALAFVGFGALTAFWSPEPHVTLFFAARLVALTLFAAYVAAALEFRAQLAAVGASGVLVAVTSAIEFVRGDPVVSIWVDPDGWAVTTLNGIHGNRNIMALTLVLALWALVARVPEGWAARVLWCGALAAVIGGIYAAGSITGLVAIVGVTGLAIALRLAGSAVVARLGRRVWLLAACAAALLVVGSAATYLSWDRDFSRDMVLSGRVPLWQQILEVTDGRDLWLGHGWGTVWTYYWLRRPPRSELYDQIVRPLGIDYNHGHNALLDPLPEIGIVGVALVLAGFIWVTAKAILLHSAAVTPEHRLVARASLLGLTALALTGVTEPMSVNPVGVLLFALIAANVVAVGRNARPHDR